MIQLYITIKYKILFYKTFWLIKIIIKFIIILYQDSSIKSFFYIWSKRTWLFPIVDLLILTSATEVINIDLDN